MQCTTIECNAIQYIAMQCKAMHWNTIQYRYLYRYCTVPTTIRISEPPHYTVEIYASMSITDVTYAMVLRLFNCVG